MDFKIACLGDPLVDLYKEGCRGKEISQELNGGALNTYRNLCKLVGSSNIYFILPDMPQTYSKALRIIRSNSIRIKNDLDSNSFYEDFNAVKTLCNLKPRSIVMSDYNRGYLNRYSYLDKMPQTKYVFVDSKYRSLDDRWLSGAENKILKCTQSEYDASFASQFDWVYVTDHSRPIKLLCGETGNVLALIPVPKCDDIKSDIGAGDSYLAGLAAYITFYNELTIKVLIKAGQKAICIAQDAIKQPKTSTTRITLEQNVYN